MILRVVEVATGKVTKSVEAGEDWEGELDRLAKSVNFSRFRIECRFPRRGA